jgi:hypothetical protein
MRIALRAGFILALLGSLLGPWSYAETVYGGTAGTGNDSLETTFNFQSQNINVRLTKPDGSALSQTEVSSAYGQAFKILYQGQDWLSQMGLQAVGADLSAAHWTDSSFPYLGQVAIDPASGRFKFATAGWQAPVRLNHFAAYAQFPCVAINDQGLALSVSTQQGMTWYPQVFANAYDPVNGWQGAIPIDPGGNSMSVKTFLALNNQGQALCLMSQYPGGGAQHVFLNAYQSGSGWQAPAEMDQGGATSNYSPMGVVLNDSGAGALVYSSLLGNHLYARYLDPVAGWSAAVTIEANTQTLGGDVVLGINPSGVVACAFSQNTVAPYYRIFVRTYQPASGWSAATAVDAATGKDATLPVLDINSSGMIACSFQQTSGTLLRQYVSLYLPQSGWQPAMVMDANTGYPVLPYKGDVLVEDNGHVVCVFSQQTSPTGLDLFLTEYRPNTGWQTPSSLAGGTNLIAYAKLAHNTQGRMLCCFTTIPTYQPSSREYLPGSGWGPITNFGPVNSAAVSLAMNNQGLAVAGLVENLAGTSCAFGDIYRVESPQGTVNVNYSYQSLTATPEPVIASSFDIRHREIKPLQNRKAGIAFALDQGGWVTIKIYSLRGDLVRTLVNQYYSAGRYSAEWGGENDASNLVASGVYLVHFKSPGLEKKQKVAVVK